MRSRFVAIAGTLVIVVAPRLAWTQSFEVGGAFALTGSYGVGSTPAIETRNPSTGTTPLTLFQSDSRVLAGAGVAVHAGVYVTRRVFVLAEFQYGRDTLRTHLSGDFEGAPNTLAETRVSSFLIGGGLEYRFRGAGWAPFLSAGGGQLRQVPQDGGVLTAAEAHGGGGIRHALTNGHHPFEFRAAANASYRSRSVGFDSTHHILPGASAGVVWRF